MTITVNPPAQTKWIVNVGDPGYAETGKYWTTGWGTDAAGYHYRYNSTRTGTWTTPDTANWSVSGLAAGVYQIYTTWVSSPYNSSNSPYTVFDGSTAQGTVRLNEQLVPSDVTDGGRGWKLVGSYTISGGTLKVQLNDNANGTVSADSIRVVASGTMSIKSVVLRSSVSPRYEGIAPPTTLASVSAHESSRHHQVRAVVAHPGRSPMRHRWAISIHQAVSGNAGAAKRPIPGSAM